MSERSVYTPATTISQKCSILLLTTLMAAAGPVQAQIEEEGAPKPTKLFESQDTLEVTISAPWKDVAGKPRYQGTYEATIEYTDDLGNKQTHPLTVARRGITRQSVCRYPPIKLRFEKENVKGSTFRGQKSLKMVTHCDKASKFEQYYVLEMLAYQMYNLVTDWSFRIRPLSVTYLDSERGKSDGPRFAFLIEDDSDVAKRHDLKKLRVPRIKPSQLDHQIGSYFSVYQYLIGNVDWAALSGPNPKECCHNVKLISDEPYDPKNTIYPVPYDFDSSGLVDAHYAAPPDGLPIRQVTQRLFRGYCVHNDTLEEARELVLSQEQAMYELIENEDRLKSGSLKKAKKYLDRGFDTLRSSQSFEKQITSRCRK